MATQHVTFDERPALSMVLKDGKAQVKLDPEQFPDSWCSCTKFDDDKPTSYDAAFEKTSTASKVTILVKQDIMLVTLEQDEMQDEVTTPFKLPAFKGRALNTIAANLIDDGELSQEAQQVLESVSIKPSTEASYDDLKKLLRDAIVIGYACLVASAAIDSSDIGDYLVNPSPYLLDTEDIESALMNGHVSYYLDLVRLRLVGPGHPALRSLSVYAFNIVNLTQDYMLNSTKEPDTDFKLDVISKKIDTVLSAVQQNGGSQDLANLAKDFVDLKAKTAENSSKLKDMDAKITKLTDSVKDLDSVSGNVKEYLQYVGMIINRLKK